MDYAQLKELAQDRSNWRKGSLQYVLVLESNSVILFFSVVGFSLVTW